MRHRLLIALLLILSGSRLQAQVTGFYALDTIQEISLTFSFSNWDYRLDTSKQGAQGYVLATQCTINGVVFDSVGVKYKGNSSYNQNNVKNPFHIKLDYVKGNQDYEGHQDIKLGNGFKDPSMIREVLGYRILRQYMHASRSNFANVRVNGTLLGLYSNSEDVGKEFSGDHFYSTGNTFFKCNPTYSGGNHPDLVYYGTDSTLYYAKYELQSNSGWGELIDLCDTLKNFTPAIEEILDVDRALWMLAFDNVTVNLDSYIGAIQQNYYLYRDNNGRFNPVVWDLNECFGTFSNTGTGQPLSLQSEINMSPTLHIGDANWPLVVKLLSNPRYKRMYIAHMRTLLDENFANNQYETWAAGLQATIDAAVQADGNKFYTYAQFLGGMTQNVTGMGTTPGISNLMDPRNTYLQAHADFQLVPPGLSNVQPTNASPAYGDTIHITASVTNGTYVRLGYRYLLPDRFTYTQMFDDGAHGDGNASDGVYGAEVICNGGIVQYYVYAENNNAGVFSPARAEHEFHSLSVSTPVLNPGDVVLNEFMAANTSTVTDPSGDYSDWLELHNTSTATMSLNGLYLSDNPLNPIKWAFPSTTTIPAGGYLMVWLDEDEFQPGLHANFKLSAAGESIMIGYANGPVLDSLTFGPQTANISLQRCPNGSGPWTAASASPNAFNTCTVGIQDGSPLALRIYPNPAQTQVRVETVAKQVRVFNGMMQELQLNTSVDAGGFLLDLSGLPQGIYFVQAGKGEVARLVIAR